MRLYGAMMLSKSGDDRRDIMATTIQQIHPVAHLPLVLVVLRSLEVATVIDRLIPPIRRWALVWAWSRSLGARHSGWASCSL